MSPPRRRDAQTPLERRCGKCDAPLASDNTTPMCARCLRDFGGLDKPPAGLTREFFSTPEMCAALDANHIGKVFRAYRNHARFLKLLGRPLSQEEFGRWLGLSQTAVSRIEGAKPEENLGSLRRYAAALHVPKDLLWFDFPGENRASRALGIEASTQVNSTPSRSMSPAISELCSTLLDYSFISDSPTFPPATGCLSPEELERDLNVVFSAYQQSKFTISASRVTALLTDAKRSSLELRGEDERVRALRVLALAYQAAASALGKAGHPDVAWISAERGMDLAKSISDPTVLGSLIRSVVFALQSTGRFESAMSLMESGASHLQGTVGDNKTRISVYGTLFLAGSMASARYGDESRTLDYLNEADQAAKRLGGEAIFLWTAFGPANVAIHRVNTAMEFHNIQLALKQQPIDFESAAIPTERQARYLLDIARAHNMSGDRDKVLEIILSAERIAPEQVRLHHLTRSTVDNMIEQSIGNPSPALSKLADRINSLTMESR